MTSGWSSANCWKKRRKVFWLYDLKRDWKVTTMKRELGQIVRDTGGRLLGGEETAQITGFCTDSREAKPGLLFVPIRGEQVDGHRFIAAALEGGAAASFVDRAYYEAHPDCTGPLLLVGDCRAAMQAAAAAYREEFSIPIVGVTGSVGKTTAKEMVAQALSAKFTVHKTAGNQNSQVGVPMTVCALTPRHTAAVVEMGVSMPGEMERIARVVQPTCAVITNIGTAHIEFMKNRETTLAEKAHIGDYLPADGAFFVNGDDPLLAEFAETSARRVVTFGLGPRCTWRASELREADKGTYFTCDGPGERYQLYVPAAGEHNVRNALCSMAVARALGVPAEDAARAIASYKAPAQRQQIGVYRGVTVIDDSYNASPDSMRTALEVLASRAVSGRRFAVLADMLELGDYALQGHREVGRYAREQGVDTLIAVGELAREIVAGYGEGAHWFADNRAAGDFLLEQLREGDAVLVKGSHSMRTDEIVERLRDR